MRLWASILTVLFIAFSLVVPVAPRAENTGWSIESVSFTSRTGGDVYPGSKGAVLEVSVLYNSTQNAYNPSACIILPQGFTLRSPQCSMPVNYTLGQPVSAGYLLEYRYIVDVSKNLEPGVYGFTLNITYYQQSTLETAILNGFVNVSEYPALNITITDVYWSPVGYPGSYPTALAIEVENGGKTTIQRLEAWVRLPGLFHLTSNKSTLQALAEGERGVLTYNNIWIEPAASPGVYNGSLYVEATLQTSDGVSYRYSSQLSFNFTVDQPPNLQLQVLDYGFTADVVSPGLNNTGFRLTLRSLTASTLSNMYIEARVENALFENYSSVKTMVSNTVLNYGDVLTLSFNGVSIFENASFIRVHLYIQAFQSQQGTSFPTSTVINIVIPLNTLSLNITILKTYWVDGVAYPDSAGNALVVELYNCMSADLRDATVELNLPEAFYPNRIVVQGVNIPHFSITRAEFNGIYVKPGVESGSYTVQISVRGLLYNKDGSSKLVSLILTGDIEVSDPALIASATSPPEISSYYWGSGTPQYVYPGNGMAPLSITIYNPGPLPLSPLVVSLTPGDRGILVLNDNLTLDAILQPGSSATAVFYLNLENASPGLKVFNVTILYGVSGGSTHVLFNVTRIIRLYLNEWGAGNGLELVSAGWHNNYPAYPNSSRAVYTITLANTLPYQVSGVWLRLKPPSGLKPSTNYSLVYYLPGPVQPFQTVSASFLLDIMDLKPGVYPGLLEASYSVVTGGEAYSASRVVGVLFNISDPEAGLGVVSYGWVTGQPYQGERGAVYYVRLVDRDIPVMNGVEVEAKLPEGVRDSNTMQSVASGFIGSLPQILAQLGQLTQPGLTLQTIIARSASATQGGFSKGDFIDVFFILNVENITADSYGLPSNVTFTDHWGSTYSMRLVIPFVLKGSPPLISVTSDEIAVEFSNGTSRVKIALSNEYDYSLYDLYIALIPQTMNAIPFDNMKYVGELPAKGNITLEFMLVYNPVTFSVTTGITASSPSIVFLATILYRDASGHLGSLNKTLAFQVKPFVEILLTPDTNARLIGGSVVVNGMLLNTGVSGARSVVVYATYGNQTAYEFLGDIDPASQTGFRVEIPVTSTSGDRIQVKVLYRDEYNNLYERSFILPVQIQNMTSTTSAQEARAGVEAYYIATVILVGVFLAGVFYLIYRKYFAGRASR